MRPTHPLTHEAIADFKRIYQEEFGVLLTDDEASAMAMSVLDLFRILSENPESTEVHRPVPL